MKTKICSFILTLAAVFTANAQPLIPYPKAIAAEGIDILTLRSNADGNMTTVRVPASRLVNEGVAVCYPDGTYKIDGQLFAPKNSKTCGIQEAINALPNGTGQGIPGGGTIVLAPGKFLTADTIYGMPSWQSNSYCLRITGAGISVSGILMTNSIPHEVLNVSPGTVNNSNQISFYMEHMFLSSVTNATTNIVTLYGHANADFTLAGCIGGGKISDCMFGWWLGLTNHLGNVSPDGWDANLGPLNLVGLNLVNNYGGDFSVDHDTFYFCIPAIIDNDNSSFVNNQIIACGIKSQNAWPTTSPLYAGYCVNFITTTILGNSIHVQDIGQNHFVGNGSRGYLFRQFKNPSLVHDDYLEGTSVKIAATDTRSVIMVNVTSDSGFNFYDITNATDWSKPFQSDTGLVQTVSWKALADSNFRFKTNAAPSNVTIGTTAPDRWIKQTNANDGAVMFMPTWLNH